MSDRSKHSNNVIAAAREELERRKRGLDAQTRLSSIVESSDDAIVSKDIDGIILTWNAGAERLFGYSADEVVGRHIHLIIPKDHQSEEDDILRRIRAGERVDHFETVRRRKDGRLVDVSLTVSPVRSAEGKIAWRIEDRARHYRPQACGGATAIPPA